MKSTSDLREFLSKQMEKLAAGQQEVSKAKAICNYAAQVNNTLNLEYKVAVMNKARKEQPIQKIVFPT